MMIWMMTWMMMTTTTMTLTMNKLLKIKEGRAVVSGTNTLIGSVATLLSSVQRFSYDCDDHDGDEDANDDHGNIASLLSSVQRWPGFYMAF